MSRPSDVWRDYGSWNKFCESYPCFSSINFDKLASVISATRDCIPCTINTKKFASGGMNVLFEAVFDDGRVWLCRVGYVGSQYSAEFVQAMMHTTVTAMRYVSELTSLRIPHVYAYEGNINTSEIGAAYMLLEPLEGLSYMDMLENPEFEVDKMRIVSNVAAIMVQLSQLTFPSIGWLYESTNGVQVGPIVDFSGTHHGPFSTSVEYFSWRAKQASTAQQTWKSESPDAALKSDFVCWLFQQAAPLLSKRNNGPFPLMHPDLWGQQLLMDMEYNVHGVIDWDETSTVPWLEFCAYPGNLKLAIHRIENAQYNPKVLASIINRQDHYRRELRRAGFWEWAIQLVGTEAVQVADCLVHFSDPRYKFEGHTIFKFLFGPVDFEQYRNDRSKWMEGT